MSRVESCLHRYSCADMKRIVKSWREEAETAMVERDALEAELYRLAEYQSAADFAWLVFWDDDHDQLLSGSSGWLAAEEARIFGKAGA